jgi:hypothetical protein
MAQRKSPFHLGIGVQGGAAINPIENNDSVRFIAPIGHGFDLNFIAGYRPKDYLDFSLGLGIQYHGQSYQYQEVDYGVAFYGAQALAAIQARIPLPKNPHSDLSIALKTGAFQLTDNQRFRSISGFNFLTRTEWGSRFFINPTVGLIKPIGNNYALIGISFKLLLGDEPLAKTEITGPSTNSRAGFGNYYLGIEFRYDWHLKAKKLSPNLPLEEVPMMIRDRPTVSTKEMLVKRPYAVVEIWDHSAEDGDTVSLELNGQIYLLEHEITKSKKRLRVPLNKGVNVLRLMAHNTGSAGENTCSLRIIAGRKRQTFKFLTNEKRHEAMEIIYE